MHLGKAIFISDNSYVGATSSRLNVLLKLDTTIDLKRYRSTQAHSRHGNHENAVLVLVRLVTLTRLSYLISPPFSCQTKHRAKSLIRLIWNGKQTASRIPCQHRLLAYKQDVGEENPQHCYAGWQELNVREPTHFIHLSQFPYPIAIDPSSKTTAESNHPITIINRNPSNGTA